MPIALFSTANSRRSRFRFAGLRACAAFLLAAAVAAAQEKQPAPPATPGKAPALVPIADYSKEALIIEKTLTKIREEADGTGYRETTASVRIQSDAGVKEMAVLEFTYTSSNQQVEIGYVRVTKPDGTVVVTPDYNVQDMPADVSREAPMYSDIHQKHVAVKGLGVGDTLEYKETERTLKPEVPGQFWLEYAFSKDLITLDEELDLDVPADKAMTVVSADKQPAITTAGARKLYHWASNNLSRHDPEKAVSKHQKPSVQVTTFSEWSSVGAWYGGLQKDQLTVTPAIQSKADALTKGLTDEDDKIKAIFDSVALKTHYVGLSFGIGRYQPHPADDVLSNEYGDCKDKHTLLATMLKAEGIEAWPVLISSSHELDPAVPSPAQFDHVITVVPRNGKLIWMDSTAEVAPVGALIGTLRDKQALAIPNGKPAYLERTPADLPYPQLMQFKAEGKLSDKGTFTGHMEQTYRGDTELLMRATFRRIPESQWKVFLQRFSNSIGFGGEVKEPVVSAVEKTSEPFHIAYDYSRDKYSEWDDRRIGPPMPPVGWELIPGVKQIKPADDIEIGSPGEQVYESSVELPAGWHVFAPGGTDLKEDWAEYHSKYTFSNGKYTAERRLVFKAEKIPLADWDKYLKFREAIYNDSVRMATLTSPDGITVGNLPVTQPPPGFVTEGFEGIRRQLMEETPVLHEAFATLKQDPPASSVEVSAAEAKCQTVTNKIEARSRELATTDPHSLYWADLLGMAWTCTGWGKIDTKEAGAAEIYLRPAWKLTQDPLAGYQLARALQDKGNKVEAAHVLELAYVSNPGGMFTSLYSDMNVRDLIAANYKKLTGKTISATPLKSGQYNGSLRAELDKDIEIRQFVKATKVSGQGLFAVTYENGQPVKAVFLQGDKGMNTFAASLQGNRFPVPLPNGSKARLLREIKLICSPWGGCDAYMLLPTAITFMPVQIKAIEMAPTADASKASKTVQIQQQ